MEQNFTDLRYKEVVNVCDGCRLGYVCDMVVELPLGHVVALVVPGPTKAWGLLGRACNYVIPWPSVRRIGDDLILVEVVLDNIRVPWSKKSWI